MNRQAYKVRYYIVVGEKTEDKQNLINNLIEATNLEPSSWQVGPPSWDPDQLFEEESKNCEDHYIMLKGYTTPNNPEPFETIYWKGNRIDARQFAKRVPTVKKVRSFFNKLQEQKVKQKMQQIERQKKQLEQQMKKLQEEIIHEETCDD